jgi:5-methylthioadenosine/S-adenosylhomocysteine deaminase
MAPSEQGNPTLIRNVSWAIVWDADSGHTYSTDIDVRLSNGAITAIGSSGTIPVEQDDVILDACGQLLLPGLINIHSHPSTEPAFRGVREDHGVPDQQMTGLFERLQAFNLDAAGRKAGATMSYAEMLSCGVTTVVDLSSAFDDWINVMRESGLRVYAAPAFASARWGMSSPAVVTWQWDEAEGRSNFDRARLLLEQIDSDPSGRLRGVVYPAQIDTVAEDLLRESFAFAESTSRLFMTHLAQSVIEVREIIRRHGMTPVAWAHEIGILAPRSTMAHCIFLDEHPGILWHTKQDLSILAESGVNVAHCPSPFARYGATMQDFGRYREAGVNIAIGTDVAPHNLIEEMRTAILAGRLASRDVNSIDVGAAFYAATIGGAAALGRSDLGRLSVGAKADLVLVDLTHPLMQPARDPLRSLIYHAADRAVLTVMVDGQIVYSRGRPLDFDLRSAAVTLAESQRRMIESAATRDYAGRHGDVISPLSMCRR